MKATSFQRVTLGGVIGVAVVAIATLLDGRSDALSAPTVPEVSEHLANLTNIREHYQRRHRSSLPVEDYFGSAGDEILREMKTENIENYLKYLTSQGHMAGTKQDLEQAEFLKNLWLEQGLDEAFLQPYDVQLDHPDRAQPNKVYLMDEDGQIKFTSNIMEDSKDGQSYDESIPPAFLAFSPSGTVVTNQLVYVNYGRYEDFLEVENMGINVAGCVVIAKFGKIFRGNKIQNAQRFNATGVILYTDPEDYHKEIEKQDGSHSFWLPGSGIQRGTIVWRDGDSSTPGYPSLDGVHRTTGDRNDLPIIPAHTISYNDARKILVNMGGMEAPRSWEGRLNITYKMGPYMAKSGWSLKLEVNNVKQILPTYNVIGHIRGNEEPDRYVILGNHRDSWVFGSCDPSSGTAVQMELARVLGGLVKKGWRPRRSIIFGSWGAGEFGFVGATEWVEEYLKLFEARAVAHINVDIALFFPYNIQISATPLLHKMIIQATKKVPAPDTSLGFRTLWDHWSGRARASSPFLIDTNLASVSDHAPFYQSVGVPTAYMVWGVNYDELDWSDYPTYHTTFEDFDMMKNILDPEFRYHLSLGQLWGLMTVGLADSMILPMNPVDEGVMLKNMVLDLKSKYGGELAAHNVTLEPLETVIEGFSVAAQEFAYRLRGASSITPLQARQLNDQLMQVEKCYVNRNGSPSRPHMKNLVFGTSDFDQYGQWLAPAVRDALWEADKCQGHHQCSTLWDLVREQVSLLQYVINSAALTLKDIRILR